MLRLPPSPPPVEHRPTVEVNPDASLSPFGRDIGACVGHARNARDDFFDNVGQPPVQKTGEPIANRFRNSTSDHGRSRCKCVLGCGSARTKRIGPPLPLARSHRAQQISTGRGILWNNLPAHVFGTLWGTTSGKLGGLHRCRACSVRQRHSYRCCTELSSLGKGKLKSRC